MHEIDLSPVLMVRFEVTQNAAPKEQCKIHILKLK